MLEVVVKIVHPLTTKQVKELPIGVHNVGGVVGLCIRKQVTTSRYFLRYLWSKKTYLLNLPRGIGLGEARKIAFEYRRQLEQGVNPKIQLVQHLEEVALELALNVKTFSDVAQEWIEYRDEMGYWNTREKVLVVVKGRLEKYIYPIIGSKKKLLRLMRTTFQKSCFQSIRHEACVLRSRPFLIIFLNGRA